MSEQQDPATGVHEDASSDPELQREPAIVAEAGSLVAVEGALARGGPSRDGEGRQLAAGQRCITDGFTDEGQDVAGSARWFRLVDGQGWVHASGGVYQPDTGAAPGFVAEAKPFTVIAGLASVRSGPSRETGDPLRTLAAGLVCAVDGYTDQGQELEGSARWYRLAGNAGWVHASGGTVADGGTVVDGGTVAGPLPRAGGEWATLDDMNDEIAAAGAKTGVPPDLIKSMLAREGSFGRDWGKPPVFFAGRPSEVLPFNGIFRTTAESRGIDFDRMCRERPYAVWAMGEVLRGIKAEQGFADWDDVAGYYFAGPNWNNPTWGDETGVNTVYNYKYGPSGVITRMKHLDSLPR